MVAVQVRTTSDWSPPGHEPEVVLHVAGAVDRTGGRSLRAVLDAVVTTPGTVTVDLYEATAENAALVRILTQFRRARHDVGLPVRFVGLHGGNLPDPAGLPLDELFVIYEQAREAVA